MNPTLPNHSLLPVRSPLHSAKSRKSAPRRTRRRLSARALDSCWQTAESSAEPLLLCSGEVLLFANVAAARLLGAEDPGQLAGLHLETLVDLPDWALLCRPQQEKPLPGLQEQTWRRIDGRRFTAEVGWCTVRVSGCVMTRIALRDISARKRKEAFQLAQNRILQMIATGTPLFDVLGEIVAFAESQSERSTCAAHLFDAERRTFGDCVGPNLPPPYLESARRMRAGPAHGSCGTAVFRAEPVVVTDLACDALWETQRAVALACGLQACTAWPLFDRGQHVLGTFAMYFRNPCAPAQEELDLMRVCAKLASIAIERHASEEKMRALAHHDALTGLPNRTLFREHLDQALRRAQRRHSQFAVLFLDLDRFKEINDNLGHNAGDRLLCEIGARLRGALRDCDKIGRIGGDEFVVLLEDVDEQQADLVARKLLRAVAQPVELGSKACSVGTSIGIALFPRDGDDAAALLAHADDAMYRSKRAGRAESVDANEGLAVS